MCWTTGARFERGCEATVVKGELSSSRKRGNLTNAAESCE